MVDSKRTRFRLTAVLPVCGALRRKLRIFCGRLCTGHPFVDGRRVLMPRAPSLSLSHVRALSMKGFSLTQDSAPGKPERRRVFRTSYMRFTLRSHHNCSQPQLCRSADRAEALTRKDSKTEFPRLTVLFVFIHFVLTARSTSGF